MVVMVRRRRGQRILDDGLLQLVSWLFWQMGHQKVQEDCALGMVVRPGGYYRAPMDKKGTHRGKRMKSGGKIDTYDVTLIKMEEPSIYTTLLPLCLISYLPT